MKYKTLSLSVQLIHLLFRRAASRLNPACKATPTASSPHSYCFCFSPSFLFLLPAVMTPSVKLFSSLQRRGCLHLRCAPLADITGGVTHSFNHSASFQYGRFFFFFFSLKEDYSEGYLRQRNREWGGGITEIMEADWQRQSPTSRPPACKFINSHLKWPVTSRSRPLLSYCRLVKCL